MDQAAIAAELLSRPLEIAVRRLADDLRGGQDASPYLGPGFDYVQSRPYQDGDPVKDIDWRVTARARRVYVKQYESLKTMPVYLVVDTSASMAVSSTSFGKHRLAALVAGGLGLAALHRLSPVGLLGCGRRSLHFRPSLSRARVFQWLHVLGEPGFDEATNLADRLARLCGILRTGSLLVVISDLHDPEAVPVVKRAAQRHDVVVLRIEDPAERGRLRGGLFRGAEAETGRSFVAHGRSRWFTGEDGPSGHFRASGIDYAVLATDRPFVPPLRRLLADRGGLTRNTR